MTIQSDGEETHLLVRYLNDQLTDEERQDLRKSLQENDRLRQDLHFLMNARINLAEKELCPSRDLLADYFFGLIDLSPQVRETIENHIDSCQPCEGTLQEMKAFKESTHQAAEKMLADIGSSQPYSLGDLLKEVGTEYLDKSLIQPLFEQLDRLASTQREEVDLSPVALGFAGDYQFTAEEKEFIDIVKNLLPIKEDLNRLLREWDKERIRDLLIEKLENEDQVAKFMEVLP